MLHRWASAANERAVGCQPVSVCSSGMRALAVSSPMSASWDVGSTAWPRRFPVIESNATTALPDSVSWDRTVVSQSGVTLAVISVPGSR
ncbi:hypothetical protein [Thermobifida alba]